MEAIRATATKAGNSGQPDLRGWLQQLAATDRLAVAREGISLTDELAAVAKKLEFESAVMFPSPDRHAIPVVANLFADRSWIAESLGVPVGELLSRFPAGGAPPVAMDRGERGAGARRRSSRRSICSAYCRFQSITNTTAAPTSRQRC